MKGGFIVKKKEMMRVSVDEKMIPVTLLQLVPQDVVRYRTEEKDGYVSVVVGSRKTKKQTKQGEKIIYRTEKEFKVDEEYISSHAEGTPLSIDNLKEVKEVALTGFAKGKGFQGVMKRHNAKGGPETHGSKFHRQVGSMGNRKPRRVMKGHPHAGHMGTQRVTLHNIEIINVLPGSDEDLVIVKGSVPGAYNSTLYMTVE